LVGVWRTDSMIFSVFSFFEREREREREINLRHNIVTADRIDSHN
jgi:hypothetical protein